MKYIALLMSLLFSTQVFSVTCYMTMVKGNCWKSYDLTVDVTDADSGKPLVSVVVPSDQLWVREKFECKAGETIASKATFSPEFWAGDEKKFFTGKRYWKLPDVMKEDETGWNVTVCFPTQFSDVPTPPESNSNCNCDLSAIPKVEPQPRVVPKP